ncbi:MAG: hypothetical protein DWB56_04695 [Candidatus Jettenia sp.]|uniref:Uncharacterized protein n=1 Tax=Candidatus Jettenia caeni TaxID=247490 RepID=I3IIG4_9BACT|nr:MAG: hypothetical protein EDM77_06885 [Candidatus Jettenia sp. AMX1]MBC6928253.1 hypothetical protein [Candidatus Jettenia sp.]MCQ3926274.1 hypothetical protein [Candidatus Jettenia sp.]GAB61509.1 hypothetical protein KSU1_B0652 [Candidatus Jettenia caeni]
MFSEEGRELLKYLVECALPGGIELYGKTDGVEYTFEGVMGLAPDWEDEGLTPEQERWVSACMLARTNYFGKHVEISMRSPLKDAPVSLRTTPEQEEERVFSLYEGDFFGNIFLEPPVAGVCKGERTPEQELDSILDDRVCTELDTGTTFEDPPRTFCGFILTGDCNGKNAHVINGQVYREVISVYLKPIGKKGQSDKPLKTR